MESDEFSQLVQLADNLVYEQKGKFLKQVEIAILQQTLQGKKLAQIRFPKLSDGYVQRDCAQDLWHQLTEVTGQKVNKRNVLKVLRGIRLQRTRSVTASQRRPLANARLELNSYLAINGFVKRLCFYKHCSQSQAEHLQNHTVSDSSSTSSAQQFPSSDQTPDWENRVQSNSSILGWPSLRNCIDFRHPGSPLLLALGVCSCLFGLSWLAGWYGVSNHLTGNLPQAQIGYKVALKLNPLSAAAHYNLGSAYEDEQDYRRAHAEYQTAIESGFVPAYNNQARLDILEGKSEAAVSLLQIGLPLVKHEDVRIRYSFLKNLGWARLEQDRLGEARSELAAAIKLQRDRAPAYCLLAQVLEHEGNQQAAFAQWGNCLDFSYKPQLPEEDQWLEIASQRLSAKELGK